MPGRVRHQQAPAEEHGHQPGSEQVMENAATDFHRSGQLIPCGVIAKRIAGTQSIARDRFSMIQVDAAQTQGVGDDGNRA